MVAKVAGYIEELNFHGCDPVPTLAYRLQAEKSLQGPLE